MVLVGGVECSTKEYVVGLTLFNLGTMKRVNSYPMTGFGLVIIFTDSSFAILI